LIAPLPFADEILTLAHESGEARVAFGLAADIWASDAAASEPCAHWAVWNIARASSGALV